MTSTYNRKTEYIVYWLGNGDPLDSSRIERLIENNIPVKNFTCEKSLKLAVDELIPDLVIIANYNDIQTNMDTGLKLKKIKEYSSITFLMVTELLDRETKDYFYQSGGNELVLEPASFLEIYFRVRHLKYVFDQNNSASIQIEEASQMALLAMENSSDLGATISFVKSAIQCNSYPALAECILDAVRTFSDSAIVEMTGAESFYYFGSGGIIEPDLKKLLLLNKGKERIVRFDDAFQVNHKNLVLVAEGLPVEDQNRMGRIVDNLAIFADTADRFVEGLLLQEQSVVNDLAKRRFISTISHELNTPMNSIQGFSKMFASRGENETLDKKGVVALESIYNNSVKMKLIIETLISITDEDVSKENLFRETIEVGSLVKNIENRFMKEANKKSLKLILPENIAMQIDGDLKHTTRMLEHLVENAIKFTERGKVEVTVSQVAEPEIGESVCFAVRDTGIGISNSNLKRLFKDVGQLNTSHDRKHYGVGLGLNYVQSFARQLNGRIDVSSEEGIGSEFKLTLPTNIIENIQLF